jgi:hypothetical protein
MKAIKSEAVQLAQIQERRQMIEFGEKLLLNPVLLAIVGYYLSDRLQGDYVNKQIDGEFDIITKDNGDKLITPRISKVWDKDAGKLNSGAAFAMQVGMSLYLGAEALKAVGFSASDALKTIPLLKGG